RRDAADPEQPAFSAELRENFFQAQSLLGQLAKREGVEVADAIVMRHAGLRRHPEAVRHALAALDRADRAAAAEVTTDDAARFVASDELWHARGYVAVRGAMKS